MKRKLSKIYTPYITLIFTLIIPLICTLSVNAEEIKAPSYMVKIIDGDSLEINSIQIRLQGIDSPEYTQSCKLSPKQTTPCGKHSIEYLKDLIKDKTITCTLHSKDKYNRELCTCYADDTNINQALVKNGYALSYLSNEYKNEELYAKKHKLGIWNTKFMHPRLFRQLNSK
ncbi:MAG: thermonuclease family protein [Alphaproteobacteria bacterium]|nr:thermonuclease family protein [Alphaproteobacteria bacterium]